MCYPKSVTFKSRATIWGCEHEDRARSEYKEQMCKKHDNFSLSKSGLIIHDSYPFMGASPDGRVKCSCCGDGTLEIKCPYSCRNMSFLERLNNESEPEFFLQENNGELSLNVYHAYYFQIQAQPKFTEATFCNFANQSNDSLYMYTYLR